MSDSLREGLNRYFTSDQLNALRKARIGIAGAGGLGSNAAMLLARCGIENMILVDHDIIEKSNLNRQHYWPRQVGLAKVSALAEHLQELNPHINLELHRETLTPANLPTILAGAPIWLEALDGATNKKMFVEQALAANCLVASASGLAGYGLEPMQKRRLGNLTIVGDFVTGINVAPPLAPRVTQAAALLADCVLEFVLPPAQNP